MSTPLNRIAKPNAQPRHVVLWLGLFTLMFALGVMMTMVIDGFSSASSANVPSISAADLTATQLCIAATSGANGDYVLIWEIYGTPTTTPVRGTIEQTSTPSPVPSEVAVVGNSERGRAIFEGVGNCSTCHTTNTSVSIGPDLTHIASIAGQKLTGVSAAAYLRTVILDPSRVEPSINPGVMPVTYRTTLSAQQLDDLIAYLLTLE